MHICKCLCTRCHTVAFICHSLSFFHEMFLLYCSWYCLYSFYWKFWNTKMYHSSCYDWHLWCTASKGPIGPNVMFIMVFFPDDFHASHDEVNDGHVPDEFSIVFMYTMIFSCHSYTMMMYSYCFSWYPYA